MKPSSNTIEQITNRVIKLLKALPGCVVNYELAYNFVLEYMIMCMKIGYYKINPTVVYHWTRRKNFQGIIASGLQVPDGRYVKHTTDQGWYGKGIYTSPDYNYARGYGDSVQVFVCLSLPGRQYYQSKQTGCPLHANYDSHISNDGCKKEWVLFKTDQLLTCYLTDYRNIEKDKYTQQMELIAIYLERKWRKYGKKLILQSMKNEK